jgi:hypothetical protein
MPIPMDLFWRAFESKMLAYFLLFGNFTFIWHILCPFGTLCGQLVYFCQFWYVGIKQNLLSDPLSSHCLTLKTSSHCFSLFQQEQAGGQESRSQCYDFGIYNHNASVVHSRLESFSKLEKNQFQNAIGYSWRCDLMS